MPAHKFQSYDKLVIQSVFYSLGNKKPWSRLARTRFRSAVSTLSSSQSQLILKACVMYQSVLSTFSQIKLDILTGLTFAVLCCPAILTALLCKDPTKNSGTHPIASRFASILACFANVFDSFTKRAIP